MDPETDEFGGVAVASAPATDDFGGVRVASAPDEFGGVPVAPKAPLNISTFKPDPNAGGFKPSMFSSGAPPWTPPSDNPDFAYTAALSEGGSPTAFAKNIAEAPAQWGLGALTGAGRVAYATAADAVSKLFDDPAYGGNLKALAEGADTLPAESFVNEAAKSNPDLATAANVGKGAAEMAPSLGLTFGGKVLNRLLAAGFTADMVATAPQTFQAYAEEINKPKDEQDAGKLAALKADIVQRFVFAPLAARGAVEGGPKAPEVSPEANAIAVQASLPPGFKPRDILVNPEPRPDAFGGIPVAPPAAESVQAPGPVQETPATSTTVIPKSVQPAPELAQTKAEVEKQPELVGMGGAVPSEFSVPSAADAITPELRAGMVQSGGPEALHTPTQSHLNTLIDAITGKSVDFREAAAKATEAFRGWLGTVAGKTLPKTTLRDRITGEIGGRYAASGAAAHPMARLFTTDVLTGLDVDPAKFDAALKADNLLSVKDGFLREGGENAKLAGEMYTRGDTAGSRAAQLASNRAYENAAKVNTLLGEKGFPFRNEGELQDYFKDPQVAEAIKRHIDNWNAVVDPKYRTAADISPETELPSRGRYSGARVNLNPIRDGDVLPANGKVVRAAPGGNLTGTMRRRTMLARRATGQGENYVLDYHTTMQNTFSKLLEIANKRDFDEQLVKSGNAVIDDVGKSVKLADGSDTKAYPLIRKGFVNKNIYVRKSLATEYGYAANVVLNPWRGGMIEKANKAAAQAALFGLTDATTHVMNLGTAMFQVPGSSGFGLLTDSILSAMGRADIVATMTRAMSKKALQFIGSDRGVPLRKYIPDSIMASVNAALKNRVAQTARLAEMNALRTQHGGRIPVIKQLGAAVGEADVIARLTLKDIFDNLEQQGLVKSTETNRREFVNQAGNYNIRTVGPLMHFLRETWIAPFATAGRNFAVLGVRAMTLNPGVEASSAKAAAYLRANMLMKWIGTAALVSTVNYLTTRSLTGRPGTPLGSIDTGKNDANGKPLTFSVAGLTGQARALRTVGARGAIESLRKGLTAGDAATAAMRDVVNTAVGAAAGPGVRDAAIAITGYAPAMEVGRVSAVAPQGGFGQILENVKAAAEQATPIGQMYEESQKPGSTAGSVLATQGRRLSLNPGQTPQMVQNFPKIVSMAQAKDFTEWVVHTARTVPLADGQRAQWVVEQVKRLPPSEQKIAIQEVLRRRVFSQ